MRILIAEDDLTSRSLLAAVLRKAGHDVMETLNGAEAWETADSGSRWRAMCATTARPRSATASARIA